MSQFAYVVENKSQGDEYVEKEKQAALKQPTFKISKTSLVTDIEIKDKHSGAGGEEEILKSNSSFLRTEDNEKDKKEANSDQQPDE